MLLSYQTFILCFNICQVWRFQDNILEGLSGSSQIRNVDFVEILFFEMFSNLLSLDCALFGEGSRLLSAKRFIFVLLGLSMSGYEKLNLSFLKCFHWDQICFVYLKYLFKLQKEQNIQLDLWSRYG